MNDAPALAQANVGLAFSNGTDIAVESADLILLKGDLNGILKARKLSRETMKNIRQNLFFAFVYNLIECLWRRGFVSGFRNLTESDDSFGGNDVPFGFGHY